MLSRHVQRYKAEEAMHNSCLAPGKQGRLVIGAEPKIEGSRERHRERKALRADSYVVAQANFPPER
jgi:hypothetical protein